MIEGIILDEDSDDESDDEDLTTKPQVCICVLAFICMHVLAFQVFSHFCVHVCVSVCVSVCVCLWYIAAARHKHRGNH